MNDQENIPAQLIAQLKTQEGLRLTTYSDTLGNLTIGYGHRPAYQGEVWTEQQAEDQLVQDVTVAINALDRALPWARDMGVVRWAVFVNMTFNMGIFRFLAFHDTINAAHAGDWEATAQGMADSLWAEQVGRRAVELEEQMRTGQWVV